MSPNQKVSHIDYSRYSKWTTVESILQLKYVHCSRRLFWVPSQYSILEFWEQFKLYMTLCSWGLGVHKEHINVHIWITWTTYCNLIETSQTNSKSGRCEVLKGQVHAVSVQEKEKVDCNIGIWKPCTQDTFKYNVHVPVNCTNPETTVTNKIQSTNNSHKCKHQLPLIQNIFHWESGIDINPEQFVQV